MDFSDNDTENEDSVAKYYSELYYVDRSTVEKPKNDRFIPNTDSSQKTDRFISRRYWSTGSNDSPSNRSLHMIKNIPFISKKKSFSGLKKDLLDPLDKSLQIPQLLNDKNNQNNEESRFMKSSSNNGKDVDLTLTRSDKEYNRENLNKTISHEDENKRSSDTIKSSKNSNSEVIALESSDDESIVEVECPKSEDALICIESSDEDEMQNIPVNSLESFKSKHNMLPENTRCTSPVQSVFSSTSDDFIQNDCTNLNIFKEDSANFSFNFKLHGSDFVGNTTELSNCSKTTLRSNLNTSTPVNNARKQVELNKSKNSSMTSVEEVEISPNNETLNLHKKSVDNGSDNKGKSSSSKNNDSSVFVTPKSKGKNKKAVNKINYSVQEENVIPFVDVYESESSDFPDSVVDVPITSNSKNSASNSSTNDVEIQSIESDSVCEILEDNLIMANVVNINENNPKDCVKVVEMVNPINNKNNANYNLYNSYVFSTNENVKLDRKKVIKDMRKFYDNSWGGESFDHIKIKNNMPNSKEYWNIDLTDKLMNSRLIKKCLICRKIGHSEDKCSRKVKPCYMCGLSGHGHMRCPNRMCLQCGSFSKNGFVHRCRFCHNWRSIKCEICTRTGHPSKFCPDLWRRYHLTTKNEIPLVSDTSKKPTGNIYCSGCAKKGHYVGNCKVFQSKYPMTSTYISSYTPVYVPDGVRSSKMNENTSNTSGGPAALKERFVNSENEINAGQNKRKIDSVEHEKSPKKLKSDDEKDAIKSNPVVEKDEFKIDLKCRHYGLMPTELVKNLAEKHKVKLTRNMEESSISVEGEISQIKAFKTRFRKILDSLKQVKGAKPKSITRKRAMALILLQSKLKELHDHIGDPVELFDQLCVLQKELNGNRDPDKVGTISTKILNIHRKLNMILVGQLGLGNGKYVISQLRKFVWDFKSEKNKNITQGQRKYISRFYNQIFSSVPRDDYKKLVELVKKQPANQQWTMNESNMRVNPLAFVYDDLYSKDIVI